MKIFKKASAVIMVVLTVLLSAPLNGFFEFDWSWLDFAVDAEAAEMPTSGTCGEKVTYVFDETTGELVISGSGDMDDYPNGSETPFCQNLSIQKVIINEGVTSIGDFAFYACYNLKEIIIPDSLVEIGKCAFYVVYGITEFVIPGNVKHIGEGAFNCCRNLTNVDISEGVESIGEWAFANCDSLTEIIIPDGLTSIGNAAFTACDKLKSVTMSDSVTYLGDEAFSHCNLLESVVLSKKLTSIGTKAFDSCIRLRNITIPDGVTYIGDRAFALTRIDRIEIPGSVENIGESAFYACTSLRFVTISDGVINIGNSAFAVCQALVDINIPASVENVGASPFSGCIELEAIYVDENNEYYSNDEYGLLFNKEKTALIKCPSDIVVESYKIPDSVNFIEDGAFSGCGNLIRVTIPDGMTNIGKMVFSNCESLIEIAIPDSVAIVDYNAFSGCESLTDVYYSGTEEQWNDIEIKSGNEPLLNATIHFNSNIPIFDSTRAVIDYGECGLNNDDDINWILYSDGELVITGGEEIDLALEPRHSWWEYSELVKKVTIGYGMTYMGDSSFSKCTNLTSITIPNSVKTISYYAFKNCTSLTDVYFEGTQEQWDEIDIERSYNGNDALLNATLHFVEKCEHQNTTDYAQQDAACNKVGFTAGEYCNGCGMWISGHEVIPMSAHSYSTVTTPATLTANGKIESICSVCGDTETETITKIAYVTLSTTNYTYNGKNRTPKVTVKDADGKVLTKNVDYKLTVASKRSGVGRYTVKVTFIGNYSGSKNVFFYIKPGKTSSVKAASQTTSSIKLSWNAVPGAVGYTVYRYSPSKKAYVKAGTTEGTSLTVKSLYAGTKYTFRVVAYGKAAATGKVYDSDSYALLKTATKTKTPSITVTSSAKKKALVKWNNVSGETGYQVWYSTSKDGTYKRFGNAKADATSLTVTGLTSGKTYYFKVRTYITTDSGYVYSAWSTVKSVKVK